MEAAAALQGPTLAAEVTLLEGGEQGGIGAGEGGRAEVTAAVGEAAQVGRGGREIVGARGRGGAVAAVIVEAAATGAGGGDEAAEPRVTILIGDVGAGQHAREGVEVAAEGAEEDEVVAEPLAEEVGDSMHEHHAVDRRGSAVAGGSRRGAVAHSGGPRERRAAAARRRENDEDVLVDRR